MRIREQKLEEITAALAPLESQWQDEHAVIVMALLRSVPVKERYSPADVSMLFERDFRAGFTAAQLFLGISKDEFQDRLGEILGSGGIGPKRYSLNRPAFLQAFEKLDLPAAMTLAVNAKPVWSDLLMPEKRSG